MSIASDASSSTTDFRGRIGVWLREGNLHPALAARLEELGFASIWIGGSPAADLTLAEQLLDATSGIEVATGIVNIWKSDAAEVAASYSRIAARHGDRFLLGVGTGHREVAGPDAEKPVSAVTWYLGELTAAGVPAGRLALAALGPRMLRLAAERTRGAHPFLVTPAHTVEARSTMGARALLVPEQRVVLETDAETARVLARETLERYLRLSNYRNSVLRQGFSGADLADGGSDRLVDALVPYGTDEQVAARLAEHLDAGADSIAVQLIPTRGEELTAAFGRLAAALRLN